MKMNRKKIQATVLTAVFVLVATTLYTYGGSGEEQSSGNEHDGIIRFHVIANSDSVEDQTLKLMVRDRVLEAVNKNIIRETMARCDGTEKEATLSLEESREYLEENLPDIEAEAEKVIQEEGFDYPASAKLEVCWIPEKQYGDVTFPAGNYEALSIRIGEGAGQNWWCVLFPPLCLIDQNTGAWGDLQMDGVDISAGSEMKAPAEGIKLKFKTIEIIDSLKGQPQ